MKTEYYKDYVNNWLIPAIEFLEHLKNLENIKKANQLDVKLESRTVDGIFNKFEIIIDDQGVFLYKESKECDGIEEVQYCFHRIIKNGYMSFDDPKMSTIVGLLVYSLGINRSYELDSSKKLMKPVKKQVITDEKVINNDSINTKSTSNNYSEDLNLKDDPTVLTPLRKDKKKGVSKFWSKVSEWF